VKRVVVAEFLQSQYIDVLEQTLAVYYDPDLYSKRDVLHREVEKAQAIFIRNRTLIDPELLTAAKSLRVVGRLGVGLDNIDMVACATAGVEVIPASGANAVSVAEYVLGAMLVLSRGIYSMTPSMLAGQWPRQGHAFGRELMGKTLGLVGYGAIARQVAHRAKSFGMNIAAYDPHISEDDPAWESARKVGLAELLATADVVSLHTALTKETIGLIDRSALEKFKPGSILINTSRGGVVDEQALADAMRNGVVAGAALDVFATEPLGPEPASNFEGIDNLILTPHVAGNTRESVDRVAEMVVSAVIAALAV
jgi:(S)-sulfolactate dehydrogenase